MSDFWRSRRVLVTGGSGFVGRNLVPILARKGCTVLAPSHAEYDLLEQAHVRRMMADLRPDVVFHLAGLIGGIMANKKFRADFCHQNLLMGTLVAHEAWRAGVRKFVTLMGGCSYPAAAPNPIAETSLWNGYPLPENAPYSLGKAMVSVLLECYRTQYGFDAITLVPGNLYGPHDNFDLENSHVIPATIRKYYEAARRGDEVMVAWGSGQAVRDFIYVEDACEAVVLAAEQYSGGDLINISSGTAVTIRQLVTTVAELVGFKGRIEWDTSKPDGQMYKVYDVRRMHDWLHYRCPTSLRDGLAKTVAWFGENYATARLSVPVRAVARP